MRSPPQNWRNQAQASVRALQQNRRIWAATRAPDSSTPPSSPIYPIQEQSSTGLLRTLPCLSPAHTVPRQLCLESWQPLRGWTFPGAPSLTSQKSCHPIPSSSKQQQERNETLALKQSLRQINRGNVSTWEVIQNHRHISSCEHCSLLGKSIIL